MKVKIRANSVEIEGYVNAVERSSKPLMSRIGRFIERICAGAFKKALKRATNVVLLLDHDWERQLGSTAEGNLELEEDTIGLHARATITDAEVVESARNGNLVGWSFGFKDRDVENGMEDGLPLRKVRDLDLFEVSLLDRRMTPAYDGTLVTTRAVDGVEEIQFRGEPVIDETVEKVEEEELAEAEENPVENERGTEESTTEPEKQGKTNEPVENPVEKIGKNERMYYNEAISIINTMKEDK